MAAEPVLKLIGVSKYYPTQNGRVTALAEASLEVESGTFKIVQGPSGSGKTTLLLAAGGLLRPDRGQVVVQGESIYDKNAEKRARFRAQNIGFVFQQFCLVPYLTVLENVMLPNLASAIDGIEERATQLLSTFRLDHRLDHAPAELSIGERQRVALARALVSRPAVLLADEPTGNLDQENEQVILSRLREFAEEGGVVLMVTHSRLEEGWDELYELKEGQIVGRRSGGSDPSAEAE